MNCRGRNISLQPNYNNVLLWDFIADKAFTHGNKERGLIVLHTGAKGFRLC